MAHDRLTDCNILIVEDDEDIRSSFELALRAEGAEIIVAGDGSSAIARCQAGDVDAVVLDMMLPKASGFVVLEKLQELEDRPVVVMVTANQGRRHMAYAESLGVDAYLNKPVSLQVLIDTLADLIDSQDASYEEE